MPAIPAAALAWWEKTVEYVFLQQACRKWDVNFLAPLGVITLQAGDEPPRQTSPALHSGAYKWLLIEFRKDKAALEAEKERFYDYGVSLNVIEDMERAGELQSHFHRVVYGKQNAQGRLCLGSAPYWPTPLAQRGSKAAFLENGVGLHAFINYVEILMPMKKPGECGAASAIVFGIHRHDRTCFCMTLDEFFRQVRLLASPVELEPELEPEPEPEPEPGSEPPQTPASEEAAPEPAAQTMTQSA